MKYDAGTAPYFDIKSNQASLAICQKYIRNNARCGDWIVGLAGSKFPKYLRNTIVYCMKVGQVLNWREYISKCEKEVLTFESSRIPNQRENSLKGDCIYKVDEKNGSIIHRDVAGAAHRPGGTGPNMETIKSVISDIKSKTRYW